MNIKAQVLGVFSGEFEKEDGKIQPYHQLEVLDTEATKKEVLRLKLKSKLLDLVAPAVGKTANVCCDYVAGKLVFTGFVKA